MSFQTISVKEAVNFVNANNNGWFLPAVQRPYVWGSRYESEKYICKLFDSVLNGYPIGTLILWNTDLEIPYREFINDYADGKTALLVDKGLYSRADKWLVYDGQQRLQTLYSCLKYTLNDRILAYNLLYEESDEEYGFEFIDKNSDEKPGYIRMPELFSKLDDEKTKFRKKISENLSLTDEQEMIFESRYDRLWSVFVGKDYKSLAYFPIDSSWNEDKVNDVFQRLNTGGVPLSGADLLFSKIKETNPSFEENLIEISKWISDVTVGYDFSANEILQLINLIVKGTTRIDASKVNKDDIAKFIKVGNKIKKPLMDFFAGFVYATFGINNSSIISRKRAMLPLMVYVYKYYEQDKSYNSISGENISKMKKYFILSQLNDWNTQGIIEGCTRLIEYGDFPLDSIFEVVTEKNRNIELKRETIENNKWFSLKIMLPNRIYVGQTNSSGRYKPEIDHIFPMKLEDRPQDYFVDVLWNFQPVSGKTNLEKSNTHPKTFFEENGHYDEYDYLPELSSNEWDDFAVFIEARKDRMITFMKTNYGIDIIEP